MASSRTLKIEFIGDTKKLERAFGRVDSKSDKTKGKFAALGGVAKAGAAAGVIALGVALKGSVSAAIEAEKSQARMQAQLKALGISFKGNKDRIEEVIQATSRLSGLDDEDLQDSFTNIVRVTGDVNEALRLNALAADFARAKHIDVAKAGELVGKVAGGNTGILSRYGITIKEGATSTEALGLLQRKFAGQAEAYGKTTAGANDRFRVAVENLGEKIGQHLLPLLAKFADWLATRVVPWLERTVPKIVAVGKAVVEWLVGAFNRVKPTLIQIGEFMAARWDNIKAFTQAAWQAIFRFIVVPVREVFETVKDILGFGGGLLGWLRDRFDDFKRIAERIGGVFVTAFGKIANAVEKVLGFFGDIVDKVEAVISAIGRIKLPKINIPFIGGDPPAGSGLGGNVSGTLGIAQRVANMFGLHVTSGWRSPQHNAAVGGVPNSLHTHGSASNPGAIDLVGPAAAMYAASSWAASHLSLQENLVHDAGSGLHLHLGFFRRGGFARGWGVVGEEGPELVNFGASGAQVYSNGDSRAMLGSDRALDRNSAAIEALVASGVAGVMAAIADEVNGRVGQRVGLGFHGIRSAPGNVAGI